MKKIFNLFTQQTALAFAMLLVVGGLSAQCPANQVNVDVDYATGAFDAENGWALFDATAGQVLECYSTFTTGDQASSVCVPAGNNIEVYAWETFGDNWNGATLSVTVNEDGSVNGCIPSMDAILDMDGNPGGADGNGVFTCVVGGPLPANGALAATFTTSCVIPECMIVCADDQLVIGNAPGLCASNPVVLGAPTFDPPGCGLASPVDFVDIAGPLTPHVPLGPGLFDNLDCTDFSVTVPALPMCTPPTLDVEICSTGDHGFGLEEPMIFMGTCAAPGAFLGNLPTPGADCLETCATFTVNTAPIMAGATLNFHMAANAFIDPNFCTNGNGIPSVIQPTISVPTNCVLEPQVTLLDGSPLPADGVYPVGCTRVITRATGSGTGSGGDPISCTTDIIVLDTEAPVIDAPGNFTFNLQGGECCQLYDFEVSGSDNCALPPNGIDSVTLGGVCDPAEGLAAITNVQCGAGTNGLGMAQIMNVTPGTIITQACYVQSTVLLPANATINIYPFMAGAPFPNAMGGFTPIVSTTFMPNAANNGAMACVAIPPTVVPPGVTQVVVEYVVTGGTEILLAVNAACADGTPNPGADGFISFCGGIAPGTPLSAFPFGGLSTSLITQGPSDPVQADPPAGFFPADATVNAFQPGSVNLPVGTHCFFYELIDGAAFVTDCDGNIAPGAAANRGTASWCITVNDVADPVTSLTCNDNLNISVDEFCQVYLAADMFLEGGPYSCFFDCYELYVFDEHGVPAASGCGDAARKSPNGDFINGFIDFGDVSADDVNGCTLSLPCGNYTYEIFDACNNNSCWGNFTVEDKIAPLVVAPDDVTINCTQDTAPSDNVDNSGTATASAPANSVSWADGTTGAVGSATLSLPGNVPGARITSLSVEMQMSHSWMADVDVFLTAPDGTQITLLDGACGTQDNVDAVFDDVNGGLNPCGASFTAGPHENCNGAWMTAATVNGTIQTDDFANGGAGLTQFVGTPVAGDWVIDFVDNVGGDGGCVEGLTINATFDVPTTGRGMLGAVKYVDELGNVVDPADNPDATRVACDDDLTWTDDINDGDCGNSTIERTWIATDEKGNTGTAVQIITIEQIGADAVGTDWFWPDTDVTDSCVNPSGEPGIILTCGADSSPMGVYEYHRAAYMACFPPSDPDDLDPMYLANLTRFAVTKAFPYTLNSLGGAESFIDNNCNLIFDFNDTTLPACGGDCAGNEKVLRDWTVLDWCSSESFSFRQIISSTDNEGPVVDMETAAGVQSSTSIAVSVDPWGCVAEFSLPAPEHLTDNCSDEITYSFSGPITPSFEGGVWVVRGAPIGMHTFTVTAVDCCGNAGTGTVEVTVSDSSPPIPVVTRDLVVGLTFSPTNPSGGAAKLFATQVDNGSFDGCGPVKTVIRRLDERDEDTECMNNLGNNGHNNNTTFSNFDRNAPFSLFDTDGGDFVTFCCEDLFYGDGGDSDGDGVNDYVNIPVELGVWDDANMDGVPGTPGDNFAITWANVRLESKIVPVLNCPPNAAVECFEDETSDFVLDNILGRATAVSNCGVLDVEFSDVCGYDQNGDGDLNDVFFMGSVSPPEPNVSEEFDKGCHFGPIVRTWSIPGTDISCEQIVIVRDPETFFNGSYHPTDVNGNYLDDDENPSVTYPFQGNEVDSDDNGFYDFTEVDLGCLDDLGDLVAQTSWITEHCSLITATATADTLEFEGQACRKIIAEVCVIDWCQFEANGDPLFDEETGDMTAEGPGTWCWTIIGNLLDEDAPTVTAGNASFPANPGSGGSGGEPTGLNCVGNAAMSAVGTDMGSCPSEWLKWVVLVDINNDWTFDFEWSSFIADDSPLPEFSIDTNGNGIPDARLGEGFDNLNGVVATSPGEELQIIIPASIAADCGDTQHRVEWTVYDGCGNLASTTSYFTVEDQKAPTPFCVNLSTALMQVPPTGGEPMVEIWAIDFDRGSFDNCTGDGDLRYSFVDDLTTVENGGTFIPENRSSFIRFTCEDLAGGSNPLLTLPVYVWDGCGNRDFCLVNLRLRDGSGECTGTGGTGSSIAGEVRTEAGEMIEQVEVSNSLMPNTNMGVEVTDQTGLYFFDDNEEGLDYEITAEKNDDHENGINTIDLILIQQHILGLRPLESAYQMIAADINNDGRVNSTDLVELRKLILGVYTEFPQNSSWRFVDAEATLDIDSPWNFDEVVEVYNLSTSMLNEDFIGVKIGDVNGTAIANVDTGSTEFKSGGVIDLEVPSVQVEAGQTFDVTVKASINDLYGYQFTLATPGLELVNVAAGELNVTEANFGVFNEAVTTSWNTTNGISTSGELFTLTFKSSVSGNAADILNVTSGITSAEAYVGTDLDIVDIAVNNTVSSSDYALYANEPNPFSTKTVIGFDLPQDANATLTVYDVTGQVIATRKGSFTQGYNTIELSKSDLGVSGVLHYTLSSGDFTATKKMIVIE